MSELNTSLNFQTACCLYGQHQKSCSHDSWNPWGSLEVASQSNNYSWPRNEMSVFISLYNFQPRPGAFHPRVQVNWMFQEEVLDLDFLDFCTLHGNGHRESREMNPHISGMWQDSPHVFFSFFKFIWVFPPFAEDCTQNCSAVLY